MKHLIIGFGEVGRALKEVIGPGFVIDKIEPVFLLEKMLDADVMHICFPYSKDFKKHVKAYQKKYRPKLTIVHSTVPVGTCDYLGVVHSPIRGVHPSLAKGIKTFVKYFGGKQAKKAAKIFEALGIKTEVVRYARTTEALKLWDTTYYGWNIMFEKTVHEWCKKHKVEYKWVYIHGNLSYNQGYKQLGKPDVVRPVLVHMPGKVGGHCVMQNCELLDSDVTKFIKAKNKTL